MFKKMTSFLNSWNAKEEVGTEEKTDLLVCKVDGSSQECDLIKELRKKQDELRHIQQELMQMEDDDPVLVASFMRFLRICEKCGFFYEASRHMGYSRSDTMTLFEARQGLSILERALAEFEVEDIDNMFNEFKALKEKGTIIRQKRDIKKSIEKEIREIKDRLGIDKI